MTVRYYPARKAQSSSRVEEFLNRHHVQHELVPAIAGGWYRSGEVPALEVDGRLFVDPNEAALSKILSVEA